MALTLFALAVGAVGAHRGPGDVLLRLGTEVLGGIGFGMVVGLVVVWLRRRVRDMPSLVALSLVTPYVAFLPAQSVHSSGVLATVTVAVWQSTRGRGLVEPTARRQTETFWRVLNTLLQGVLFVLLGVQARLLALGRRHPDEDDDEGRQRRHRVHHGDREVLGEHVGLPAPPGRPPRPRPARGRRSPRCPRRGRGPR